MPRATAPTMNSNNGGTRSVDWKKYGASSGDGGDRVTWRPAKIGDTITGQLGRVDEANTPFGSKVVIELDECVNVTAGGEEIEGEEFTIWPTPGLINALADAGVDKGDRFTISLGELVDTGKGNPFKRFLISDLGSF